MIAARLRPFYEAQAKDRKSANGGDKTAEVQKVAPPEKTKARDDAGKAAGDDRREASAFLRGAGEGAPRDTE
jgi:hypothetical protein